MSSLKTFSQSDYDRSIDKENGSIVFKGQFSFEDLKKEKSFNWFEKGIKTYSPDSAAISFLKKTLNHYNLVIVLGTWCGDSHDLIPKLYSTLINANYSQNKVLMYGVDRAKETKYVETKLYHIEFVPTIILLRDHKEVGRIVETAKKNIEEDLRKMIEEDQAGIKEN